MRIVTVANGLNATVGLFENGACRTIIHEERLSNKKNFFGFPLKSLALLDRQFGFGPQDLFLFPTRLVLPSQEPKVPTEPSVIKSSLVWRLYVTAHFFYKKIEYFSAKPQLLSVLKSPFYSYYASQIRSRIVSFLQNKYHITKQNIHFLDHHTCHCLTPVYFFGLDKSDKSTLIFSMDGVGDSLSAKAAVFDPETKSLSEISKTNYSASIGLLYAETTRFLGMKPHEDEYKVMGLAAYVSDRNHYQKAYEALKEIIWLDPETLQFRSKFPTHAIFEFLRDKLPNERFDNLAAALQAITEDLILTWVKATIKRTGIHQVALTGGVFMNVKVNQKLLFLREVKRAYFQPSCGDESLVIGAAAMYFLGSQVPLQPINTMYLGFGYSNTQVKQFLVKNKWFKKYKVTYHPDIEYKTAKLVAANKIVARFKGRGEWGARALGNRSILGNASRLETFYEVNDTIKMRDFWMPFAPSIISDWANKYIKDWPTLKRKALESTRFMILSFDSTQLAQKHLKAAMHPKDKTIRPQVVFKDDNPDFYKLIKYYEKFTGMGGLLNTSFNLHGYPLVGTLKQAKFTFENSNLQYMTLENYLVKKK